MRPPGAFRKYALNSVASAVRPFAPSPLRLCAFASSHLFLTVDNAFVRFWIFWTTWRCCIHLGHDSTLGEDLVALAESCPHGRLLLAFLALWPDQEEVEDHEHQHQGHQHAREFALLKQVRGGEMVTHNEQRYVGSGVRATGLPGCLGSC